MRATSLTLRAGILALFVPACAQHLSADTDAEGSTTSGEPRDTTAGPTEGTSGTAAEATSAPDETQGTGAGGGTEDSTTTTTTGTGSGPTTGETDTDFGGESTDGATGPGPDGEPCCETSMARGCSADPDAEACVCGAEPQCCEQAWGPRCVRELASCGRVCPDRGGGTGGPRDTH
jgi:hypothetical protein